MNIASQTNQDRRAGDMGMATTRAADNRASSVSIASPSPQAGPMLRSVMAGAQAQVRQAEQGIGAPSQSGQAVDARQVRSTFMDMDRQTSQGIAALPAYQQPTRGIGAGQMEAANTVARDPARKSIAYVDSFNQDAASRGMDVQKVIGKDGAVTYTDGNAGMGQQFTNHGIPGIAAPFTGHQIRQAQGEIDTSNAQAAQQAFERSQMKPADRIKLDSAQARMGLDQARAEKASAEADHVGEGRSRNLSLAQENRNAMIDAARTKLDGLTSKDVLAKTQQYTATGRENPDFDPELARAYRLANTRKIGDDPTFDAFTTGQSEQAAGQGNDVSTRFAADPAMKGYKPGKATDQGVEVYDEAGNLVGHYR